MHGSPGLISGSLHDYKNVRKEVIKLSGVETTTKYRNLSYKCTRCRHKYFSFIVPLELRPYLFSQCFPIIFWLKFLKMLVFKLEYLEHELETPIFFLLQLTESALHFENLENRLVL